VQTSFLQRKIRIGYGKAAKYIDDMERLGVCSESNGAKARCVYITLEEWEELKKMNSDD
jgi:S-DNA-T family DNA segregation ATPase FtsK/SpoIIIE